ncbi:MAG: hypothetical protein K0R59_1947 [Sphingobacterium sp.]|jgi:hypothetical protein|nr:hypothetical protein [Sphingobacterium sp.]
MTWLQKENNINMKTIKSGQIWTYKTRVNEIDSKVAVLAIEKGIDGQNIIHVKIDNLRLFDSYNNLVSDRIDHLPISERAFLESVLKVVAQGYFSLGEGYYLWKSDFDLGKGGIWDINLEQVISSIESNFGSCEH